MPFGQAAASWAGEIGCAVIDGGVEAKLVLHVGALLGAARDADRPRAGDLRELADQRPDRSARRRDDHRFPGLGLTDHAQAAIRGETWHPEYAEPGRDRRDGRIELAQVRAIRQRVRAPSGVGKHDVAFRVAGMFRGDHRRNGFALHHTTERNRLSHTISGHPSGRACTGRAIDTATRSRTCPALGVGIAVSSRRKSLGFGRPCGRAARTIWRAFASVMSNLR